ncbi:MAG: response regulator [Thainema sp.]
MDLDLSLTSSDMRILVVEDESVVAYDLQDVLEDFGYQVVAIADCGEDAIAIALEQRPDLILMDIRLQGELDGTQVAQQIRQHYNVPIVYLTAHTDNKTLKRVKATSAFGYLTKPFREKELHTSIEVALYRSRIENQLVEREQWLKTLLDSVGDAIIAVDQAGIITLLNPAAQTLTTTTMAAVGQPCQQIFDLLHERDRTSLWPQILQLFQTQTSLHLTDQVLLVLAHPAQFPSEIPIDLHASPVRNNQGDTVGVVITCRDLRSQREAQATQIALERAQQLEQQMTEMERISQLKDDFLNTVSHELRSPLANIKVAIEMLGLSLKHILAPELAANSALPSDKSSKLEHYFNILQTECQREINLINDLLDLQRLETEVVQLKLEAVSFEATLRQVVEPFQIRAHQRQQQLTLDCAPAMPPLITEAKSLTRILSELLNNACKYTPPHEQIKVVAFYQANLFELRITNSGTEIPEAELGNVFKKFYRLPFLDQWHQGGTGLGLALVQRLVDRLQGKIFVESGENEVSFVVLLPHLTLSGSASSFLPSH